MGFWIQIKRRKRRPLKPRKRSNYEFFSYFFGIIGVISLVVNIGYSISAYRNQSTVDFKTVIAVMCFSIASLILVSVATALFYIRQLNKLNRLPIENKSLQEDNEKLTVQSLHKSECIHNITHYHRNTYARIKQFLEAPTNDIKDLEYILDRFDFFLVNVTASLHSYFTIATGDNCSATIKVVNQEKGLVKTFFRDPNNLKRRRVADQNYGNKAGIYSLNENTAFDIITNEDYFDLAYGVNDLTAEYDDHAYTNSNIDWHKHYNATLVVPISILLENNIRNIIGFITIDNFRGGLANKSNLEFLYGVGDLLYNIFDIYGDFINIASKTIKNDGRIKRFLEWN